MTSHITEIAALRDRTAKVRNDFDHAWTVSVINELDRTGGATREQLADVLGLSPATIKRTLAALEAAGQITHTDPTGQWQLVETPSSGSLVDDWDNLTAGSVHTPRAKRSIGWRLGFLALFVLLLVANAHAAIAAHNDSRSSQALVGLGAAGLALYGAGTVLLRRQR